MHAEDIIAIVTHLVDPRSDFETKHSPDEPSATEQTNLIKIKMWELKAKRYLDHEEVLNKNVIKIYGLVMGQ